MRGLSQFQRRHRVDDGVEIGNGAGFVFVDGNLLGSIQRIVREELERDRKLRAEANAGASQKKAWLWRVWEWGKK